MAYGLILLMNLYGLLIDSIHVLHGWMYGVDGSKIFEKWIIFYYKILGQDPDSPESL